MKYDKKARANDNNSSLRLYVYVYTAKRNIIKCFASHFLVI